MDLFFRLPPRAAGKMCSADPAALPQMMQVRANLFSEKFTFPTNIAGEGLTWTPTGSQVI